MNDFVSAAYDRFAIFIALLLLMGTAVVIVIATFSFLLLTWEVLLGAMGGTSYATLQRVFDALLGAIIALELAHSVKLMVTGQRGFGQVRIVLVIGILAVVRKLIVIELEAVSGFLLLGLAAAIIALGGIYGYLLWLDRDGTVERD
ncbi:phosphate-starvation-inducible PsiE family protein [Marivita sp.]|uniref:phosphate-starvation-inducible PsiE family protein n=1 Tax=Marivita sp. TaxID=2003365 RepID=UPI003F729AA5